MMTDVTEALVLHPRTRLASQQFIDKPTHGLLIIGPTGAGKKTLALAIAAAVLEQTPDKLANHPYFLHLSPQGSSISIDTIREAQAFVRLRTTGQQPWRRALLVENAHQLTVEAQNAFLKLLEEPPADTLIILTATGPTDLLPTITSRTAKISVKPVGQQDLTGHFATSADASAVQRAYHLSGGFVGLMGALLDDQSNEVMLEQIQKAKQFLQAKPFERLIMADQYAKQKDDLEAFLWALLAVSKAALYQAGQNHKTKLVNHWQKAILAILQAQDALAAHPLPKLLLTDLSLQL